MKKKYTITITLMIVATILLLIGKVSDTVWQVIELGCLGGITAGYIGKKKYGE